MIPRGGLDFPVPACINEMHNFFHLRRSGGTGRRAGLKIPWPQGREGSTPSSGTSEIQGARTKSWPFSFSLVLTRRGSNGRGAPSGRAGTLLNSTTEEQNQEMSPVDMES